MLLGGLDIGTTGCKLSVYEGGVLKDNFYREYESTRNTDVQEINASDVWNAVKEIIEESKKLGLITAIGVTSFGESFAMLDKDDNVLIPSMLYTDPRGNEEYGIFDAKKNMSITGLKPHGMYGVPKIMWVKKHRPEIYEKTDKILFMQDFIVYMLTGKAQIDYSLACRSMGFDIKEKCWSKYIFETAGLDISKMAKLVVGGTPAGYATYCNLGIDETLIVTGCHDQVAALTGAGVFETGQAVDGAGTVECITPIFDKIPDDEQYYLNNYCVVPHLEDGKYVTYAFSYTGGAALKWFRDTFASDKSYKDLDQNLSEEPTGIMVLPHFAGAATPYMDENSKAAFVGVTLGTTKEDLYKAVMEGVAYEMRLNMENINASGINPDKLYATGGGANSKVWLQIKADILNKEIIALDAPEAGAAGTVMLTGVACGVYKDLEDAAKEMVKVKGSIIPNPEMHKKYMKIYENYKKLYSAVRPLV